MESNDRQEHNEAPSSSSQGREATHAAEMTPDIVATTDPTVARGRGGNDGPAFQPEETIVAETSRVTGEFPGYLQKTPGFVEPERVEANGQRGSGGDQGGDHKTRENESAHSNRPGWMSYAMTAALALACGVGGAWAFSHFNSSSKAQDQSKGDGKSDQANKKGSDADSKGDPSSKVSEKGQKDGGSSTDPGSRSSTTASSLKEEFQHLSDRLDTLQQRFDLMAMPRDSTPPDLRVLRVKIDELSRSVGDLVSLPSQLRHIEDQLSRQQVEVKNLLDQIALEKAERGREINAPKMTPSNLKVETMAVTPSPPPRVVPAMMNSADEEAMTSGIVLFKEGKYSKADDVFRRLQLTRPQDARVWYYSALAHGLASGQWEGETKQFVIQGADREREGLPTGSQIDDAFANLSPAQGKEWLASYRSRLIKH